MHVVDNKHYLSWAQITVICEAMANSIKEWPKSKQPKVVVGVVRGGAIPAVIISHLLGVPCKMVSYSSTAGKGDNKDHVNVIPDDIINGKNQLFVDDIVDTGRTFYEISQLVTGTNAKFVALVKRSPPGIEDLFTPDLVGGELNNDNWVIFPWEDQ